MRYRVWSNVHEKARGEEMTAEKLETLIASGEGERDASRREHERTA